MIRANWLAAAAVVIAVLRILPVLGDEPLNEAPPPPRLRLREPARRLMPPANPANRFGRPGNSAVLPSARDGGGLRPVTGMPLRPLSESSADRGMVAPSAANKAARQSDETAESKDAPAESPAADGQSTPKNAGAKPDSKAMELFRQAYTKSESANSVDAYSEIIELCNNGLAASPPPAESIYGRRLMSWAYNKRGEARADGGDEQAAFADFRAAVELNPRNWRAIHNRGVSYALKQQYPEAMADFSRTIELNPQYSHAWFNRGEVYYEQGNYEAAVRDYSAAMQLAPRDPAAYNSRGHAYYRLNRFREALQDYNEAVVLDPENAAAYTNRGDANADLGRYADATTDYREAARLDPHMARAFQSAAWLMATCPDEQFRDSKLALQAAKQAIELDNNNKDYRYLETMAAAEASAGLFDEAQETQTRALALAPAGEAARQQERLELYKKKKPYREGPSQESDGPMMRGPRRMAR